MSFYIELAKKTVESYIKEKKIIKPPKNIPVSLMSKKRATFVTILKNGNFRACIGTIKPTKENLIDEIIYNSIAAATNDYRLGPIRKEELSLLTYEVYILSKPVLVKNIKNLDPKKYGVIVEDKNFKTGVLLPNLEGVDTVQQQLSIALQKANIKNMLDDVSVYRFKVKKY